MLHTKNRKFGVKKLLITLHFCKIYYVGKKWYIFVFGFNSIKKHLLNDYYVQICYNSRLSHWVDRLMNCDKIRLQISILIIGVKTAHEELRGAFFNWSDSSKCESNK